MNSVDQAQQNTAPARVLDVYWSHPVVVAPQACLELIEKPELLIVPGTKSYVQGLLRWQGRWVPVLNMQTMLSGKIKFIRPKFCLIVMYRYPDSAVIEYGALLLKKIADTISVTNDDAMPLPDNSGLWPLIADSCVRVGNHGAPIINIQSLFCNSYSWED